MHQTTSVYDVRIAAITVIISNKDTHLHQNLLEVLHWSRGSHIDDRGTVQEMYRNSSEVTCMYTCTYTVHNMCTYVLYICIAWAEVRREHLYTHLLCMYVCPYILQCVTSTVHTTLYVQNHIHMYLVYSMSHMYPLVILCLTVHCTGYTVLYSDKFLQSNLLRGFTNFMNFTHTHDIH